MGGTVAVTLRKPDGETLNMLHWTNIIPEFLTDSRMYSDDPSGWIAEFTKDWEAMRDDYARNAGKKGKKRFQYEMTDAYFPWDATAPEVYGLFLVDLQRKHVYHAQGYCSEPTTISTRWAGEFREFEPERSENLQRLIDAGHISRFIDYRLENGRESLIRPLSEFDGTRNGQFLVEPQGFTLKRFDESEEGFVEFFFAVRELGLIVPERDHEAWMNFLVDRYADEDRSAEAVRRDFLFRIDGLGTDPPPESEVPGPV